MKKNIFLLLLFTFIGKFTFQVQAQEPQDSESQKLLQFINNVSSYNFRTPQEKVYLHLDNNGYFIGEMIWFKAYVVRASSLKLSDLSQVLYVDLLSQAGQTIEHKRLKLVNGQAHGEFSLTKLIHSGFYEVRAYTREMLNWNDAYIFSRIIPVFDKPAQAGDFTQPHFYHPDGGRQLLTDRPQAASTVIDAQLAQGKPVYDKSDINRYNKKEPWKAVPSNHDPNDLGINLNFYPEGGHLVSGTRGRIAYLLTDSAGTPLNLDLELLSKNGYFIEKFRPLYAGMGLLELPDSAQGGSVRVIGKLFPLPVASTQGVALTLFDDSLRDSIDVMIQSSISAPERQMAICVTCRGEATYANLFRLTVGNPKVISIPRRRLKEGVNQVTIFDEEGHILADRLFFQRPKVPTLRFQVVQDKESYNACQPVDMAFRISDEKDRDVATTFSLAIHDHSGDVAGSYTDLCSNLLLTSDLRGYIANPYAYFTHNDSLHRARLDLLMMVQGWRRYDFEEMAMTRPFIRKQPIESQLLFDGHITPKWNPEAIGRRLELTVGMYHDLDSTILMGSCTTDTLGRFIFGAPDIYGPWTADFSTRINGKLKNYHVMLNRNFRPKARPYFGREMEVIPSITYRVDTSFVRVESKADKKKRKKGSDDIELGTARVTAKRFYHVKDEWDANGGEARGARYADRIYDMREELEEYSDAGNVADTATLDDWFRYKFGKAYTPSKLNSLEERIEGNAHFTEHSMASRISMGKGDWYNGRPIALVGGNNKFFWETLKSIPLWCVKTIMISEDPQTYQDFIILYNAMIMSFGLSGSMPVTRFETKAPPITIFIYEDLDKLFDLNNSNLRLITPYELKDVLQSDNERYSGLNLDKRGHQTTYLQGYSAPKLFDGPMYGSVSPAVPDDYRRTLYWDPDVKSDDQGHAQIRFYTNSRKTTSTFGYSAQGITADGRFLYSEQ